MLPSMTSALNLSLIKSIHGNVTSSLEDESLVLKQTVGKHPYLTNGKGEVYCIANEEVQLKQEEGKYIDFARSLYENLPASIKKLAERKLAERNVKATSDVKPGPVRSSSNSLGQLPYTQPDQIAQASGASDSIAKTEDTSYVTLKGYFSDIDKYDCNFKKDNESLFNLMKTPEIRKVACDKLMVNDPGQIMVYQQSNGIFDMTLPRLLMLTEQKDVLEGAIKKFKSVSEEDKKAIAADIAMKCFMCWQKMSEAMRSNKESYDDAMKGLKKDASARAIKDKVPESTTSSALAVRQSGSLVAPEARNKLLQAVSEVQDYRNNAAKLKGQHRDWELSMASALSGCLSGVAEQSAKQSVDFEQMKATENSDSFQHKKQSANDSKAIILSGLKQLIDSRCLVNTVTGDLFIPKVVSQNSNDCDAFKEYALDLVCHYRKALLASLKDGCKDDVLKKVNTDTAALEHISILMFQLNALISRNEKT